MIIYDIDRLCLWIEDFGIPERRRDGERVSSPESNISKIRRKRTERSGRFDFLKDLFAVMETAAFKGCHMKAEL